MSDTLGDSKKNKSWKVSFAIVLAATLALLVFGGIFLKAKVKSEVHQFAQTFFDTGSVENPPSFLENTPEYFFVQGLIKYADNDYTVAADEFLQGEKIVDKASDPGLVPYLYCYLNSSIIASGGEANVDYVKKGLEAAAHFKPIADNHSIIWENAGSIAYNEENDPLVRELLQNIIDNVSGLNPDAEIRYRNCIAMLCYFDGEYSESIRRFYDVKSIAAQHKNPSNQYQKQLAFANSYVAGFYYEFDDFETAARMYEENIRYEIEDKKTNAKAKYADYINLSSCYIELGMPDEAEEVFDRMEEIFPYLQDEVLYDVKSSAYDNMAQSEIMKGNFDKANEYMSDSLDYLALAGDGAFYGSEEYVKLTRAKLFIGQKDYESARAQLEELYDSPEAEYAGLTHEVCELLGPVYKELGDHEAYIKNQDELLTLNDDFDKTIKNGYLEFSRYYDEAENAKRINNMLRERNRFIVAIILGVIFALAIVIVLLIRIRNAGYTDQLTGIKNRRALQRLDMKYQYSGLPAGCAIIMIDIDYFKRYNDFYGHVKGDEVLKSVAKAIQSAVRKKDFLIRYGGEEFLVFIENAKDISYEGICERIVNSVKGLSICHEKSNVCDIVTISLGLCVNKKAGKKLDEILVAADEALYEAKNSGRNGFVIKTVEADDEA